MPVSSSTAPSPRKKTKTKPQILQAPGFLFQEIGAAPTHPKKTCSSLSEMGQHPTTNKMLNHEAPISQTVVY
jgi:hypothetical protein